MYKVGRDWFFASASIIALSQFLFGGTVKADTTNTSQSTTTTAKVTAATPQSGDTYMLTTSATADADGSQAQQETATTLDKSDLATNTTSSKTAQTPEQSTATTTGSSSVDSTAVAAATDVQPVQKPETSESTAATPSATGEVQNTDGANATTTSAANNTSSTPVTDLTSQLPAGSKVTTNQGKTVIQLPANNDLDTAKQVVSASGIAGSVEINAAAADTGAIQLSGKDDEWNTVTNDEAGYGEVAATDAKTASESFTVGGVATMGTDGTVTLLPVKSKNEVAQYIFNNNLDMTQEWSLSGYFNFADTWNQGQTGWSFANGAGIIISGATPAELAKGNGDASLGIGGIPDTIIASLDMYNNPEDTPGVYKDADTNTTVVYKVTADTVVKDTVNTDGNPGTLSDKGILIDPGQPAVSAGGLAVNSVTAESTLKFMTTNADGTIVDSSDATAYAPASGNQMVKKTPNTGTYYPWNDQFTVVWTPTGTVVNDKITGTLTLYMTGNTLLFSSTYDSDGDGKADANFEISTSYDAPINATVGLVAASSPSGVTTGNAGQRPTTAQVTKISAALKTADVTVHYEGLPDNIVLKDSTIHANVGDEILVTGDATTASSGTYIAPSVSGYHVDSVTGLTSPLSGNVDNLVAQVEDGVLNQNTITVTYAADSQTAQLSMDGTVDPNSATSGKTGDSIKFAITDSSIQQAGEAYTVTAPSGSVYSSL